MTLAEFEDWFEYFKTNLTRHDAALFGQANICAAIFNASGKLKRAKSPADFLPKFATRTQQTAEQMKVAMSGFAGIVRGTVQQKTA